MRKGIALALVSSFAIMGSTIGTAFASTAGFRPSTSYESSVVQQQVESGDVTSISPGLGQAAQQASSLLNPSVSISPEVLPGSGWTKVYSSTISDIGSTGYDTSDFYIGSALEVDASSYATAPQNSGGSYYIALWRDNGIFSSPTLVKSSATFPYCSRSRCLSVVSLPPLAERLQRQSAM
ncbi:hypothetical protein [Alicyclobacillus acidoterrestris]|uniref:Uncharacterized protein n=1 Tax=Alicyclobacillus acidoterrestris (strain ATCC 49025 / DSM 3922 / CIP 106132 / NCIMB 13137 / GD3B) TaxID=1356854 RepID=A0A9E6ZE35_ALIAG|nr:hypothetical protein [Alicyclobacillus acidoterrestris]UNO47772.1 hypothetical protein K1I37_13885 [Alicyclobacillus acidoterrestris]